MSFLETARAEFSNLCIGTCDRSTPVKVSAVTFQPLATRTNQDRLTYQFLDIKGQEWILLAICDGHSGSHLTAEHTISSLPARLRASLQDVLEGQMREQLDRGSLITNAGLVSSALVREVERFDEELGAAIIEICPDPEKLTEDRSKELVRDHLDTIQRAYRGCTLGVALINVAARCMWTLNVGDTTIGLSSEAANGRRDWVKLSDDHKFHKPLEYFRVMMSHPHEEIKNITEDDRMLEWLDMTRSIGDYAMKLPPSYITHLFSYLPERCNVHPDRILTPPYLISTPSVSFTDLDPVWNTKPIVLLFSDGVDIVADWYGSELPGIPTAVNTGRLVAQILGNDVDRADATDTLGHPVDPSDWTEDGNQAVEVLANLFGGMNAARIEDANRQAQVTATDDTPSFYVDDTSLIVCTIFE